MAIGEPVNHCCECGGPIYESMGATLARDVMAAMLGGATVSQLRQGCPKCATRWANDRRYFRKILRKLDKDAKQRT